MHRIKCGHCSTFNRPVYHADKHAVYLCARAHAALNRHRQEAPVTTPQPAPIVTPHQPSARQWTFNTPRVMVENMREGRYAVEVMRGNVRDWVFIRVSRPTRGKRRGCLVLQTQHSDYYKEFITLYPSGQVWFAQRADYLDQALLMVAADPFTSAINYGRELGCCSRCARELTDERSRHYSIGPECEKYWPEIINYINETKGVFAP